jgi:predicted amidophosphoribosyltransferase
MKTLPFTIRTLVERFFFGGACAGCKTPGAALCESCLSTIRPSDTTEHDGIYGLYDYGNPMVSHAVWNLKYRKRGNEMRLLVRKGVPLMHEIIAEHLQSEEIQELTLVPAPQYKKKTRTRGFNQSILIANWIAKEIDNARVEEILEKTIETLPQSHLSDKHSRMKNISGTMRTVKQLDKHTIYILIDDVTTTGATFLEAKRALKSAGAKHILCIAVAHGYKRR